MSIQTTDPTLPILSTTTDRSKEIREHRWDPKECRTTRVPTTEEYTVDRKETHLQGSLSFIFDDQIIRDLCRCRSEGGIGGRVTTMSRVDRGFPFQSLNGDLTSLQLFKDRYKTGGVTYFRHHVTDLVEFNIIKFVLYNIIIDL